MNKRFSVLLLTSAAALALSACANHSAPSASGNEAHAQSHSAGGACRSIGEGRKINNKGKNDAYLCSARAALNSSEAKQVLNPNIHVSYGNVGGKTLVSRQIANAVNKTPEETCQRAFLSAVKRFQSTAQRYNSKSVHVVSYFDKKTVGGDQYECHIGTWNSRVVLKGSI
ncbi:MULTISPECIES: hypothetical protein [unclassified Neisseria]|uniref:hypothetical protein n=1 Tax=unclassified Neisseria TaxID=2623750 RepID=UPI002666C8C6|nr:MULTISPECIES: hypothetical protein [unclassified Neisseria]MDO1509662.1 hypothetical protein [Neisseria sp. MVDL19-042950]MDO1516014.1 hypothetical protein [Neisseria sp. MVDL18-041461]MDO1563127.1 hypothetical protein [Neisseria sp. MVDL20-010259]